MNQIIRLLVVDDHPLFRGGLVSLLSQYDQFFVVAEAGNIDEAQRLLQDSEVDLILLDNHLPDTQGVDAIGALKSANEGVRVLMLTMSENGDDLVKALQNGADGYLLKTSEPDQLCDALERVYQGESVVSPAMMSKLVSVLRQPSAPEKAVDLAPKSKPLQSLQSLSPREMDIFLLVAKSLSNKHIARDLNIAETTVKIHIQHIFKKLQMTSRVQIAVFVATHGLS